MKWLYRKRNSLDVRLLYGAAGREGVRKFGPYSPRTQHRIGVILKRYNPEKNPIKLFLIEQAIPFGVSLVWSMFVVNATFEQIGWWTVLLAIVSGTPITVSYAMFVAPWLKGSPV